MPELPCIILINILSRLPTTTLLQCKCVCRTWFAIISDPHFARLHLARAPVSLLFSCKTGGLSALDQRFYVLALDGWQARGSFAPLKQLPLQINHLGEVLQFESSCNGLLCISGVCRRKPVTYVCNLITGEFIALPEPESDGLTRRIMGFCFSETTERYKIIQEVLGEVDTQEHENPQIEVCTLGSKRWRKIDDFPYKFPKLEYNGFTYSLNGALHWLIQPHNKTTFICHFDIENEQFRPFPGPPVKNLLKVNHMHLGEAGGYLCLCEKLFSSYYYVDIWVMTDYGVEQSWTKEFVVRDVEWTNSIWHRGPVQILNFGLYKKMEANELYILHNSQLSAYNAEGRERKIQIKGIDPFHSAIPYIPSLVSLKEAVVGESSQELIKTVQSLEVSRLYSSLVSITDKLDSAFFKLALLGAKPRVLLKPNPWSIKDYMGS